VEALTAFLFACVCVRTGVFQPQDVARAAFWCTLISLLIVAAFVDWDHMIIPDEVSLGGVALGCLGALLHPPLLHAEHWWEAAGLSVLGALVGYGLLWAVAQGGRLLFGRARLVFETPVSVVWEKQAVDPVLRVGEEELLWSELFFRGSERIILQTVGGGLNGDRLPEGRWEWSKTELKAGSRAIALEGVDRVEASVVEMQLPREVMGMGDVKLLAAIGAFLGWQAVLFVLTAGASLGALAGGVGGLVGRRDWASRLPFGPYLALGAVWWIFAGGPTLKAYWRLIDAIRVSL
jgi:leader peptidase (prepilin peptidase)/N-methyltransferase